MNRRPEPTHETRIIAQSLSLQNAVSIWLGSAALADIIITATLIVKLRRAIGKGFTNIDSIISKLIKTTLQTGLLTTVVAVTDLILYLSSTTTLDMVFNFPLANLYVISLLSTLNARIVFRDGGLTHTGVDSVEEGGATNNTKRSSSYLMGRGLPRPLNSTAKVDEKEEDLPVTPLSFDGTETKC